MKALQEYQRTLRPFMPGRDGLFLANTWGDRSRDARVNEEFMLREIEAGARLGVEVIQIDDGWQKGRTSNSAEAGGVWNGFWAANENFWDVHPERFPNGLAPLIARARERGMQFGLWFAPDSSHHFANWQRDVVAILKLHRELGVNYFKIDGVKAETSTVFRFGRDGRNSPRLLGQHRYRAAFCRKSLHRLAPLLATFHAA
jgi:alpha-galactosidase